MYLIIWITLLALRWLGRIPSSHRGNKSKPWIILYILYLLLYICIYPLIIIHTSYEPWVIYIRYCYDEAYGLGWWLQDFPIPHPEEPNGPGRSYISSLHGVGWGGQFLFIIPEKDTVCITFVLYIWECYIIKLNILYYIYIVLVSPLLKLFIYVLMWIYINVLDSGGGDDVVQLRGWGSSH